MDDQVDGWEGSADGVGTLGVGDYEDAGCYQGSHDGVFMESIRKG